MTRIIGTQTITMQRDVYERANRGWYRRTLVIERELHATKGWKAPRIKKTNTPITYNRVDRPQSTSTFKRW